MTNRVVTTFGASHFLVAKFCDSNGFNLPPFSEDDPLAVWMRSTIENGFAIGSTKYAFVGCSSSQLREAGAWFVAVGKAHPTPKQIWDWMGDFSSIKSSAKLLARMGLFFSSAIPTVEVPAREFVQNGADIDGNGFCFTDGAGLISREFARQVATCLHLTSSPSAYQVRIAGCKGVLAVSDAIDSGIAVVCTKSMTKIRSSLRDLCVLAHTKPQPAFLNQQLVLLMTSRGVPDLIIERLFHNHVENLRLILSPECDDQNAALALANGVRLKLSFAATKNWIKRDPWHLQLTRTVAAREFKELREKLRIRVPDGQLLMGIPDWSRFLAPNQVFCQITLDDGNTRVITGLVLVAKNPTLWPGDGQILEAVDIPGLREYRDCIVFSTRGDRPVPNKCAGSDLDGDLYTVLWDRDIILHLNQYVHPIDYPANEAEANLYWNQPLLPQIASQFATVTCNSSSLGRIANVHLVVCDQQGALNTVTKELALEFSKAVDFPKTGIPGLVPDHVKIENYPHFMSKEPSYESQSIIGRLYTECARIFPSFQDDPESQIPAIDERVVNYLEQYCKDYQSERIRIKELKIRYDAELHGLMATYGVQTEAELLSGNIVHPQFTKMRTEKLVRQLEIQIKAIQREYQANMFPSDAPPSVVAALCYLISLKDSKQIGAESTPLLSFPWLIAGQHLNRVLVATALDSPIESPISLSLAKFFESNVISKEALETNRRPNERLRKQLATKLNSVVGIFGSKALLLDSAASDVDFCAAGLSLTQGLQLLQAEKQFDVRKIPDHPACTVTTKDGVKFDVSFGREGPCKTLWAQRWLASDDGLYWRAAKILCDWARGELIISQLAAGYMPLIGFLVLIHNFATNGQHPDCRFSDFSGLSPQDVEKQLAQGVKKLSDIACYGIQDRSQSKLAVDLVLRFLRYFGDLKRELVVPDPLSHVTERIVCLDSSPTLALSVAARRSLLALWATAVIPILFMRRIDSYLILCPI